MKEFLKNALEIKKNRLENPIEKEIFMGWLISKRISYLFSAFFIKKNIIPNQITVYMIVSGIVGGIFFSIPNIYLKMIGSFFIQLWFIFDFSDGEVARKEKKFSKYGKELDYMAHIINHPIFSLSIMMSLLEFNRYKVSEVFIICMLSTILDLIVRNIISFRDIISLKESEVKKVNIENKFIKKIILILLNILTVYPNIPLLGSILYFIDYIYQTNLLIYYLMLNVIFTFIVVVRELFKIFKAFY